MPKLDLDAIAPRGGVPSVPAFAAAAKGRLVRDVGAAGGLTDFAAMHVVVPPGSWSAQRHWHEDEDEIVVILSGTIPLVDDTGRTTLKAGDIATFRKGDGNAHHLRNEGDADCVMLAISLPERSPVHYPDIAMTWTPEGGLRRDDGTAP